MSAKFFEKLSSNLNQLLKDSDEYNVIIKVGRAPNIHTFKYSKLSLNKYIYDGTITLENINTSVVFELLIASNEFGLEELIKHLQLFLLENNSSWLHLNFSRVCRTSLKNDSLKNLQEFCANIIAKHPSIIFDLDEFLTLTENILIFILKLDNLQMDEGKIWDYIINWGIAQNPSLPPNPDQWSNEHFMALKSSLQNFLPLIRYFQISGEDIFEKAISTSNVLPSHKNLITTLPLRDISDKGKTEIESNRAIELRKGGDAYRIKGKYEESLIDLTKSLEIEANNANALSYCGATYYMMNRYEESLADLNKSLEIEPDNTFALKCRGAIYYWMDRYEESLADLSKALEIKPNDAFALKYRGAAYYQMDRYEESLADYNKSLEIEPDNAFALKYRGEAYRMTCRYEESLADLNQSLKIEPNDANEESLADFNKSLEIEPDNVIALKYRGATYLMMGRYEESLADLNHPLEIMPNIAWTLNRRGNTYCLMGKYKESLVDLNKSLEIEPNYEDALGFRGETYRKMGKYKESLADLDRSLKINPNDKWILNQRQITYRLLDK
ncbi:hypothetical protein C2G38_2190510 [Gigaspora rosea]|uniref:BACK domain-containing protein n=1 Tax=Gigaspora rosea TaxID=44941 RepID=A0A397V192_9GLOM|nr:hypothetical protein C2G38_2190510 [Gigaspora rosea]